MLNSVGFQLLAVYGNLCPHIRFGTPVRPQKAALTYLLYHPMLFPVVQSTSKGLAEAKDDSLRLPPPGHFLFDDWSCTVALTLYRCLITDHVVLRSRELLPTRTCDWCKAMPGFSAIA